MQESARRHATRSHAAFYGLLALMGCRASKQAVFSQVASIAAEARSSQPRKVGLLIPLASCIAVSRGSLKCAYKGPALLVSKSTLAEAATSHENCTPSQSGHDAAACRNQGPLDYSHPAGIEKQRQSHA